MRGKKLDLKWVRGIKFNETAMDMWGDIETENIVS